MTMLGEFPMQQCLVSFLCDNAWLVSYVTMLGEFPMQQCLVSFGLLYFCIDKEYDCINVSYF